MQIWERMMTILVMGTIKLGDGEGAKAAKLLADHAAHLVVHGTLHLLGHDHEEDDAAETMEEIESKALATMGIADPYSREERPSGVASGQE